MREQSIDHEEEAHLNELISQYKETYWVLILVFVIFAVYAAMVYSGVFSFSLQLAVHYNQNLLHQQFLLAEQKSWYKEWILSACFTASLAAILAYWLQPFFIRTHFQLFLWIVFAIFSLKALRLIIRYLASHLLAANRLIGYVNFKNYSFEMLFGMLLPMVCLLTYYSPHWLKLTASGVLAVCFLITLLYDLVTDILHLFKQYKVNPLQFLLYICAFEISIALILFKSLFLIAKN